MNTKTIKNQRSMSPSRRTLFAGTALAMCAVVTLTACKKKPSEDDSSIPDTNTTSSTSDNTPPTNPTSNNTSSTPPSSTPTVAQGVALPDDWPIDVPFAPYMTCMSVARANDSFMVSFHAPDRPLTEIIDWFSLSLDDNGWKSTGDTTTETNAILSYTKDGRKLGITLTDFVLTPSAQRDNTTRGITIQTPAQKK